MLFNNIDIHKFINWMNLNKLVIGNIYNDQEILRIKGSTAYYRTKDIKQAEEFVTICKFYSLLIKEYNVTPITRFEIS